MAAHDIRSPHPAAPAHNGPNHDALNHDGLDLLAQLDRDKRVPANLNAPPLVSLRGITKRFGSVVANEDITLDIQPGRVKALLGENGAGKSTLMSILAGRFAPDEGQIFVDSEPTVFRSAADAIELGIGMVYQHFMLVETMTVAENVLLGQEPDFFLNPKKLQAEVGELAERYGLEVDPAAVVGALSMGERQRVEILKLLYRDSRVLIFDEPTAVLTPEETFHLFEALWKMTDQGKAVVFISHKLEEVIAVADEIAILRHGRIEGEFDQSEVTSKADLARRMVGRDVVMDVTREAMEPGEAVLEIKNLTGIGLTDVNLEVRRGEIVAVVGVAGNGQKALVEAVCGLRRPPVRTIYILRRRWREYYAKPSWRNSLSYIPEDRAGLATLKNLDMVDNLLLTTRQGFTRGPILELKRAGETALELVQEYDIRPGKLDAQPWQLSGGNLQKSVLARELYREPKLIVAEQPTQGLDVNAAEEVWKRLLAAREGAGILLVTGDLSEALHLADRVAVIYRGRIMDTIPTTDAKGLERIGLLMAGVAGE
ncbi:MAG: ABC transporter ATP-binding protein [Desulfovibrionaceae bacterium]